MEEILDKYVEEVESKKKDLIQVMPDGQGKSIPMLIDPDINKLINMRVKELTQSILKYDNEGTPDGNVREQARTALEKIKHFTSKYAKGLLAYEKVRMR